MPDARWRAHLARPYDLRRTMTRGTLGPGDPTGRFDRRTGAAWRASGSPAGPVTYRVRAEPAPARGEGVTRVTLEAWGPGSGWAKQQAPRLTGLHDRPDRYRPQGRVLRDAWLRCRGMHLPDAGRLYEPMVAMVLHQLVTTDEGMRAFRGLTARHGQPAPGPPESRLRLPPGPELLRRVSVAELTGLGAIAKQARALHAVAEVAVRLEDAVAMGDEAAVAHLTTIRGVGPWTATMLLFSTLGRPDVAPVGDYHIPSMVSWALAGEARAEDPRMLELLEPHRPDRGRAVHSLLSAGVKAPRRGPKVAIRAAEDR